MAVLQAPSALQQELQPEYAVTTNGGCILHHGKPLEDWQAIVGANVRRIRQHRRMTQEELAFAAKIDLTYVGGIERGRRNPSLLVMARIAEALEVSPAKLLAD